MFGILDQQIFTKWCWLFWHKVTLPVWRLFLFLKFIMKSLKFICSYFLPWKFLGMLSSVISLLEEVPVPYIPEKWLPPQQNGRRWHCSMKREKSNRHTDIWRWGRFDAHCQQLLKFLPWTVSGTLTVLVYNSHHSGQLAAKSFKLSKYIPTQDTSRI